jgi:hypothetical protein
VRVWISLTLSPFGLRSAGAAQLCAGASMAQSAVMTASAADSKQSWERVAAGLNMIREPAADEHREDWATEPRRAIAPRLAGPNKARNSRERNKGNTPCCHPPLPHPKSGPAKEPTLPACRAFAAAGFAAGQNSAHMKASIAYSIT